RMVYDGSARGGRGLQHSPVERRYYWPRRHGGSHRRTRLGAAVAWHCALLRPDIFRAVVLLSVPYRQRSWADIRPTEAMKQMAGEKQFYQLYFQEPGKAEPELEADVRKTMLMGLYTGSGDAPPDKRWRFLFDKSETFLDTGTVPETLPAWLTEADLDLYTEEFKRTGF